MKVGVENERIFLVLEAPLKILLGGTEIVQGYLGFDPSTRIRIEDNKHGFFTAKIFLFPGVNYEIEDEIFLNRSRALLALHKYNLIYKTRCRIGRQEIDVFHRKLDKLVKIEIEINSGEEKKEFSFPEGFVAREVTGDKRFSNANLCKRNSIPRAWRCKDAS